VEERAQKDEDHEHGRRRARRRKEQHATQQNAPPAIDMRNTRSPVFAASALATIQTQAPSEKIVPIALAESPFSAS
jgi:hypothetical protein